LLPRQLTRGWFSPPHYAAKGVYFQVYYGVFFVSFNKLGSAFGANIDIMVFKKRGSVYSAIKGTTKIGAKMHAKALKLHQIFIKHIFSIKYHIIPCNRAYMLQ
jgi:hypothetical protein